MFFPYPYTDLYNLNLDWMIKTIKEMQAIVEPLDRIVNSVNGITGDVQITKDFLLGILGNMVESFNGRHGDVNLTLDDVNGVMIDVLWISAPGDTLADLSQYSLDSLYRNGRRIMIFINNANVPDTVYFLKWVSGHAFAQLYSPTAALAGVASFNGQTGNVTATGSDLHTSDSDSTSIADTLSAQSQQIDGIQTDLSTQSQQIDDLQAAAAYVDNGEYASQTIPADSYYYHNGTLYYNSSTIAQGTALPFGTAVLDGGLNKLNRAISKYHNYAITTESIEPNKNGVITFTAPVGATIFELIPYGYVPNNHWNSNLVFTAINIANKTLSYRCIGSGASQTFSIKYIIISDI